MKLVRFVFHHSTAVVIVDSFWAYPKPLSFRTCVFLKWICRGIHFLQISRYFPWSQRARMENLTIKCLDMIFLTDLGCMNIIRLLRHQKTQKNWKRPKNFLKAKSKATIQFYQIFTIFLAFMDPLDPKIQPLPYFLFQRPLRPKRPLKGQKLLTWERGKF